MVRARLLCHYLDAEEECSAAISAPGAIATYINHRLEAQREKSASAAAGMIFATTLEIQFCKLREQSLIFVYVPYKLAPTAQSLHSANRLFLSAGKAKEKRVVDYTHGSSSVLTVA